MQACAQHLHTGVNEVLKMPRLTQPRRSYKAKKNSTTKHAHTTHGNAIAVFPGFD